MLSKAAGLFPFWFVIISVGSIGLFCLNSCSPKNNKLQQYYAQGEALYLKHCSNCHQQNGKGLGLLYPPLSNSDYIDSNLNGVICLIEKGRKGEMIVNGKSYNMAMPGIPSLTDLEIAEIATFLYNSWDRESGLIEVKDVTAILQNCP